MDGQEVTEEKHRRSPAARSYSQDQARSLFKEACFEERVEVFSEFTDEPAKPSDMLFSLVGQKAI